MNCRFAPSAARREYTLVDNGFLVEYLPNATGTQVQVYLLGLMQCYHPEMDGSIAETLGISEQEVINSFCYWQTQKLVRIQSDKPLCVEYLSVPNENGRLVLPAKYSEFISSLNTLTSPRQFSSGELARVYDWIEVYGLDEGAVLELVAYCMDKKGRRISVNYMNSVAQSWAEEGIRTFEQARKSIEKYDLSKHGATGVLRQWNKTRKPTRNEMDLYTKWTEEWGFSDEAILKVLPRLSVSGNPNFALLDGMLEELKDKKLTGTQEIENDDAQTAQERAFVKMLFDRAGRTVPATAAQRAQISVFLNQYGMPREMLLYAAECSRGKAEPFGYMKILLNEWHEKGITTVAGAEECYSSGQRTRQRRTDRGKSSYEQRQISDADFEGIFLDLDQEIHGG